MASSREPTRSTESTGPKISSRYTRMDGVTWSTKVGPTKNPSSPPGTFTSRPSRTTSAPSDSADATYPATRSRWAAVISGPMSEPGSRPGPVASAAARSDRARTRGSASPTTTTAEMAMQRSPADP